ncbi:hypothetical protein BC939DRAFT_467500 [Gamsiella multidivaricata]|uniref:uncharacterized protein n=1 Tax=Gamsiella multidivaricata TaxID=101098 RepID=UPI00221F595E|nr:uncharacterized protein BC939DRAFT_467500 [Gamsiella multidivaricata]KAI7816904.1 hypothetical protein BC939DRAFT_467500 [Gamsiella multidivaricata]
MHWPCKLQVTRMFTSLHVSVSILYIDGLLAFGIRAGHTWYTPFSPFLFLLPASLLLCFHRCSCMLVRVAGLRLLLYGCRRCNLGPATGKGPCLTAEECIRCFILSCWSRSSSVE